MAYQAWITPADIQLFVSVDDAKAQALIDDAVALAALSAPCILDPDFPGWESAKAIVRGAVVRRAGSLTGSAKTQTAGRYSVTDDTRATVDSPGMFTDDEVTRLENLCPATASRGKVRMGWLI